MKKKVDIIEFGDDEKLADPATAVAGKIVEDFPAAPASTSQEPSAPPMPADDDEEEEDHGDEEIDNECVVCMDKQVSEKERLLVVTTLLF